MIALISWSAMILLLVKRGGGEIWQPISGKMSENQFFLEAIRSDHSSSLEMSDRSDHSSSLEMSLPQYYNCQICLRLRLHAREEKNDFFIRSDEIPCLRPP